MAYMGKKIAMVLCLWVFSPWNICKCGQRKLTLQICVLITTHELGNMHTQMYMCDDHKEEDEYIDDDEFDD